MWLIRLAILAAVAGTSATIAYTRGKSNAEVACAQQGQKEAEQKVVTIIETVTERVPVVQIQERDSSKLKAELALTKKELADAIAKRDDNPACALSDDEWMHFNRAAEATRR